MVARGIRKAFNNNLELQLQSIADTEQRRLDAIDDIRFRRSVSWYHQSTNIWIECEYVLPLLDNKTKTVIRFHTDIPKRIIFGLSAEKDNKTYLIESGFIADGLPHVVWTTGGEYQYDKGFGRYLKAVPKLSKCGLFHHYTVSVSSLPGLFNDIYDVPVSIPMIQQAFKTSHKASKH